MNYCVGWTELDELMNRDEEQKMDERQTTTKKNICRQFFPKDIKKLYFIIKCHNVINNFFLIWYKKFWDIAILSDFYKKKNMVGFGRKSVS